MATLANLNLIVMTPAQVAAARKPARGVKAYECLECGKALTGAQALRAVDAGCPKCGGVDIDVARAVRS